MRLMTEILQKAKAYLDARRGERVTLSELARAVGASPFHLQRRFKEAFGVSPRDYQDAYRMEAVKSSLRNGSRVGDAAADARSEDDTPQLQSPYERVRRLHPEI